MRSRRLRSYRRFLSKHFRMPGIPRRRIVVEIVDVDSSEFLKFQQVWFSKLLNLNIPKKGDPLRPRRFPSVLQNALFSSYWFHWRCAQPIESCSAFLNSGDFAASISSTGVRSFGHYSLRPTRSAIRCIYSSLLAEAQLLVSLAT